MLRTAVTLCLAFPLACAASPEQAVEAVPSPQAEEEPEVEAESPPRVTESQADALARDLVASIRSSTLDEDERHVLLARTPPDGFIDHEGRLRIGPWLLMSLGDEWVLFHRFLPPDPRKYLAHSARVTRTSSGFSVAEVRRVLLHPPRGEH